MSATREPLLFEVQEIDGDLVLLRRVGGGQPKPGAVVELRPIVVVDMDSPAPLVEAGARAGWR